MILKIKCTIFLKQLYYVYYNTKSKSATKGITVVCFYLNLEDQKKLNFLIKFFFFHENKIEKLVNYLFESCCVNVCTKLYHYGNLPIYYNYQALEPTKELEGYKCINMRIAQHTPSIFYNRALNPCFVYAFVITTSLHFCGFKLKKTTLHFLLPLYVFWCV